MLKPSEFAVGDRVEVELKIVYREPDAESVRFTADVVDRVDEAFVVDSDGSETKKRLIYDWETGRWTVKRPRGDTWARWNREDKAYVRWP